MPALVLANRCVSQRMFHQVYYYQCDSIYRVIGTLLTLSRILHLIIIRGMLRLKCSTYSLIMCKYYGRNEYYRNKLLTFE